MGRRLDLQDLLETLVDHVYFQPPESIKMQYPCIVYARSMGNTLFADDKPYAYKLLYQLTVISRDSDDPLLEKVVMLPTCVFVRPFVASGLYHNVHNLYY